MSRKSYIITLILAGITLGVTVISCHKDDLPSIENNIEFFPKLSMYHIFSGNPANLIPNNNFHLYILNTGLFTDYAEKQRLVMIPADYKMSAVNDGLAGFPEGTMLVKTFFYYNDRRDTSKGKRIIETRLLIKNHSKWNAVTYLWNDEQTDALLLPTGINRTVNWIDEHGNGKVISYHVPSRTECVTCHNVNSSVTPIGPKIRNLNKEIFINSAVINQLKYFSEIGILNPVEPSLFSVLPDWHDGSYTIEQRARAYMEVNCAHCHNEAGFAAHTGLRLAYELPFDETGIDKRKELIVKKLENGSMPKLGTTIIDEEGVSVVRSYMESLK